MTRMLERGDLKPGDMLQMAMLKRLEEGSGTFGHRGTSSVARAYRGLEQMKQRVTENPSEIVEKFILKCKRELRVQPGRSWSFHQHYERGSGVIKWGRMRGLWRCYAIFAEVLSIRFLGADMVNIAVYGALLVLLILRPQGLFGRPPAREKL